jgi:Acetyl-CoA acetyltransferase
MREAVIVSSVRTPIGRAFKGTLRATRPDELAAVAIKGALDRVPQLDPKEIEDVILGCAMPEAEQGMNVAHRFPARRIACRSFRDHHQSILFLGTPGNC